MNCSSCGAKTFFSTTSDVTDLMNCLVIVRNTPCYKCTECNEVLYTGDVVKRLELIINDLKQSLSEVTVFDYCNVAA